MVMGTSLGALAASVHNVSPSSGVGTGQPGSGVNESSTSVRSDSQMFLTGDGSEVTAKSSMREGMSFGK